MTYQCAACLLRGKDWTGDDPTCGFAGPGAAYSATSNWNCATINALRELCYEGHAEPIPGVDYRYCQDMKYATVHIDDVSIGEDGDTIGMALWVSWYKSRGRTDAIWVLDSSNPPRAPTEAELVAILKAYQPRMPT